MIDPDVLLNWHLPLSEQILTQRDTIFYALSLGLGDDPLDLRQLRFVYERDLSAFPTLPVVLCYPGPFMKDPRLGIDYSKIVHGEQRVTLHGRLPVAGTLRGINKVIGVADRGSEKGAAVCTRREIIDGISGGGDRDHGFHEYL